MTTFSEVVGAGVDDDCALPREKGECKCCVIIILLNWGDGVAVRVVEEDWMGVTYANDAVLPNKLHQVIANRALGIALAVCLEIS